MRALVAQGDPGSGSASQVSRKLSSGSGAEAPEFHSNQSSHITNPQPTNRQPGSSLPAAGTPIPAGMDREQLLLEHLPFVRFIARKLHQKLPQHVELDDLVSAGAVGLLDACSRFNPDRHVQFRSFAQFRIRGAILDSLRELDWSPRELRRKGRSLEEAKQRLAQQLGRAPLQQEIAAEMKLSLPQLQQLRTELNSLEVADLSAENQDEPDSDGQQRVAASPEEDPLFLYLRAETRQRLAEAIEGLPERERLVLTLYYYEELSMCEIGLILGVVESRVSQIRSAAIRRLKKSFGLASLPAPETSAKKTVARRAPRRLSAA